MTLQRWFISFFQTSLLGTKIHVEVSLEFIRWVQVQAGATRKIYCTSSIDKIAQIPRLAQTRGIGASRTSRIKILNLVSSNS
jgi:hypothetical protein